MSRDDRRYVLVEREEGGSSLGWFLLGGVLGAGLALLFAPQSGDRTRRIVGRKLGKLRDAADAALDDLRDTLSHPADRTKGSLEEGEEGEADEADTESEQEDGRDHAERAESPKRGSARSARRELEHRLAEARARRQRALADEDEEPVA